MNMPNSNKLTRFLEWFRERITIKYQSIRQPNIARIQGIKIRIGNHISENIRKAIYFGDYENLELKTVKCQLKKDDVVMEIGAGIGFISSYCAKKIGSDRVFTYEANPALETHIYENYKLNGVCPTLEVCLVGDQSGEIIFYVEKEFWVSSITPSTSDANPIKVPMKSFNEEVKRLNPTFLIIDIEGGEYELVKQADFHNVKNISIEIHEILIGCEKSEFVKSRLCEAGFKVNEEFSGNKVAGLEQLFLQR